MLSTQVSWQHSPRAVVAATAAVAAAAAAAAAVAEAKVEVGTKPHGKRKNSAQTATRWSSMILQTVSPSRPTRTNVPWDGAPNTGDDRNRVPKIMAQY
jgi:hypothetical protein